MKVLVTGAGGFLGQYVVRELLARGHAVRAMLRPSSPLPEWADKVEIFRADLRVNADLVTAFEGIDALVHAAAATSGDEDAQFNSTVAATERLLDAMLQTPVRRVVLVSSLVVYDWSRARKAMDETTPLADDIYSMGAYTIAKVWQERIAWQYASRSGVQLTVLRPGFIWAKERLDIAGMGRRIGRISLMLGPMSRLPLTHAFNCAQCIAAALETDAAIGESFNVVDSDEVRVWSYVTEFNRRTGAHSIRIGVPYLAGLAIAHLAQFTSRTLFGENGQLPSLLVPRRFVAQFKPIRFPNDKARQILRWTPAVSFLQGFDAIKPGPAAAAAKPVETGYPQ